MTGIVPDLSHPENMLIANSIM